MADAELVNTLARRGAPHHGREEQQGDRCDDRCHGPGSVASSKCLHELREAVGDQTFFRILRTWAQTHRGGNGSTPQFIALAEKLSGKDLNTLFTTWLYTATKPAKPGERTRPST